MITQQNNLSSLKKPWTFIVLTVIGTLLNLIAILTDGNSGALVAIGCSLIAIGIATSKRKSDRQ